MAAEQATAGRVSTITSMGQRYLSRWMSWSGTPTTPPGTPSKSSPIDGALPASPQPPRVVQNRSRNPSKISNMIITEKNQYPLVPKLPVPPLGHTLTWYLMHLKPILTKEDFEKTSDVVQEFGKPGGVGEQIQEELIKRHDSTDNWVYQWWLEDMYLNIPLPLPINSNPGMVFPKQEFRTDKDMFKFAAKLLSGAFDMKDKISQNDLDVDRCTVREKHQPLCMEQYGRIFTSYRRPGIPKDKLIPTIKLPTDNQHIIVLIKHHVFQVNIVFNGFRMDQSQIVDQLTEIQNIVEQYEGADPPPIGIMTADNRWTWAQNRQILVGDADNLKNINIIESCVLVLCIDGNLPSKFNQTTRTSHRASLIKRGSSNTVSSKEQEVQGRDEVNAGHQMIHGGGYHHNSGNRWFDKTIQFIITKDGWCGLCYEHSNAEGIAVIQLVEQILQNIKDEPLESPEACQPETSKDLNTAEKIQKDGFPMPTRLEWKASPVVWKRIQESADNVDRLVESLDFRILRYTLYGRKRIKMGKCSPDAFLQLSLQLAYFRTHGRLISTYESASTRRFRQGRVDTIRANTTQALEWIESMVLNAPIADRLSKFDTAHRTQVDIMVNNILGKGIDIHLLGLREMAKEKDFEVPDIFKLDSYAESNHFRLSTSQVPTVSDSWMGYGPVCPDGYGASYNPHEHYVVFCLSAFHTCESTSTLEFGKNLERALDDMMSILESRAGKK